MLEALDPDPDAAGEKYELLRRKLISYFRWHGARFPEDSSDETLSVTARRMAEGEGIVNVSAYCRGVAGKILLARHREEQRMHAALEEHQTTSPAEGSSEEDIRTTAFEQSLQDLPAESRDLILTYYEGELQGKISARKQLAERLGIPLNALRIRACRIRARLEASVRLNIKRRSGTQK